MSRVVVLGAGDFGREVAAWIRHDEVFFKSDTLIFLDDNPQALDRHPHLTHLLSGDIKTFAPHPSDRVLMGISNPRVKKSLDELLTPRGVNFATFVHKSVQVTDDCRIGSGTILCPNVVVASAARLGRLATVNIATTIGHDVNFGDYASAMSHVDVTGWVTVEEGAFLGSNCSVLPRTTVGEYATVGAGSVVNKPVAARSTVAGVPARPLRT